ncbi:MAG: TldD/PmbA family protein [Gemmatimonadota bacterium]|nr:TldD/PmbA family protein [Gemmatimonadota bacterium]
MSDSVMSRAAMEALAKRVLAMSAADETRVNIVSGATGNTRFAAGDITTSGDVEDTVITITSTVDGRRASSTTNLTDDASLKRAVDTAERLARLSPRDPELVPELGAQQYQTVNADNADVSNLTAAPRAQAVEHLIAAARAPGGAMPVDPASIFVAGFLEASSAAHGVATSRGLFAYHASTDVSLSCTARTQDGTGSGYASAGGRAWSAVDPATLGRRAAQKALASRNPVAVEPGRYTVILEPRAVADFIPLLMGSFNARSADEGRSPFSKKGGGTRLGEKIADERVTLISDPFDPDLLGQPFDTDGLPLRRTVWIENGVLRNLAYSRYWAQKKGVEPTGGGGGGFGRNPAGLKLMGGTKSTDELIAGTERGVLVTHFFYIRALDPRTVLLTGLTRDGTFLIENGKITKSIKNFRWNDSPLLSLARLADIGRAEPIEAGVVMPALKINDFTFSSLSDAV